MLRPDDPNQIIGSSKIQRRNSILAILGEAELVDSLTRPARKPIQTNPVSKPQKAKGILSLQSGQYCLVKGKKIGSSCNGGSCSADENATGTQEDRYDLWEYLQDIRIKCGNDPPRSSIYFPENAAGPDLVFALEPEGTNCLEERILGVVQVKTGEITDIHDAIRTTDLCSSYLGESAEKERHEQDKHLKDHGLYEKRRKLMDELEIWHLEGRHVIRILIATDRKRIQKATREQITTFKNSFLGEYPKLQWDDYFVLVPGQDAEKFFGNVFCSMLTELKANKGTRAICKRAELLSGRIALKSTSSQDDTDDNDNISKVDDDGDINMGAYESKSEESGSCGSTSEQRLSMREYRGSR